MQSYSSISLIDIADKSVIFERLRKHFWGSKLEEIDGERLKLEGINRKRLELEKSRAIWQQHYASEENKGYRKLGPVSIPPQFSTESSEEFSSGIKDYYVTGKVNQSVVEALPDTGASTSFISSHLASRLGLRPDRGTHTRIKFANQRTIQSPGRVTIPWEFAGERETYMIKCWIFPGCIHDLVLGNHFLEATHTLQKFKSRIKCRIREGPKQLSLSLLGEEKQRLRGYLNGHLTAALPDTGSDAMFINKSYARKIGLEIDCDARNQLEVEFADGSTAMTSGIARDLSWEVGGKAVRCNFHVLEHLSVDIILSHEYLFRFDVFMEQEQHLFDIRSKDRMFHLCNVRLVKKKRAAPLDDFPNALSLVEQALEELEKLEKLEKLEELYRRDKIRDEIMELTEDQKEAATQAEYERQQRWEALRTERRAKWTTESHTTMDVVHNDISCERSRWSRWKRRIRIGIYFSAKEPG